MENSHPYRFHPTILREYDVRGIVGETIHAADYQALGVGLVRFLQQQAGLAAPRIMVGRDGRLSSPAMAAALLAGIQAAGGVAETIEPGPTPMLYFSVYHTGADAGVMVTGSHNPPSHNGAKLMIHPRLPVGGSVYGQRLKEIAALGAALSASAEPMTDSISTPVMADYVARLLTDIRLPVLRVVWDAGNGAAAAVLPDLLARLPGEHVVLFGEMDGTFPNHHPDPTEEKNLRDLQREVTARGFDLGVAFDGDGDRIGAIDAQGRVLAGDQLLALYARMVLTHQPGATIIADAKASQVLFDEVARLGGQPLMWKTGHSLIKTKMAETKAPLAGEMSGHMFFADRYYGFDDALYAALRLLEVVGETGQSLAALRDSLPPAVNTPELRFTVPEERKFTIVDEVRARLAAAGASVNTVDGVRVLTEQGWWLLRASNTQNALIARAEARDAAGLSILKQALVNELRACGIQPPEGL